MAARYGLAVQRVAPLPPFRHVFTHFTLTLEPESVEVGATTGCAEPGILWHRLDQLDAAAGAAYAFRKRRA